MDEQSIKEDLGRPSRKRRLCPPGGLPLSTVEPQCTLFITARRSILGTACKAPEERVLKQSSLKINDNWLLSWSEGKDEVTRLVV